MSSFDREAEQEVDFGRYVRLLGARWWLVAAGLVVGAVIGYAISLGGSQQFKATATLYLGQPYSASGNVQLQAAQTNPSTVRQVVTSQTAIAAAAKAAKLKPGALRGKISVAAVSGNLAKLGQTPLVTITVRGAKRDKIKIAANALAAQVIQKVGGYADRKIAIFRAQISKDEKQEAAIQRQIDQVKTAVAGTTAPSVLLEVDDSTPGKLYVFGGTSFGDELAQDANAHNIFHANSSNGGYPAVSDEAVISANPQYVILTEDPVYGGDVKLVYKRANWTNVDAVKSHKVYHINVDIIQRPGPRLVEGLQCLAQLIHPDKFTTPLPAYCNATV